MLAWSTPHHLNAGVEIATPKCGRRQTALRSRRPKSAKRNSAKCDKQHSIVMRCSATYRLEVGMFCIDHQPHSLLSSCCCQLGHTAQKRLSQAHLLPGQGCRTQLIGQGCVGTWRARTQAGRQTTSQVTERAWRKLGQVENASNSQTESLRRQAGILQLLQRRSWLSQEPTLTTPIISRTRQHTAHHAYGCVPPLPACQPGGSCVTS